MQESFWNAAMTKSSRDFLFYHQRMRHLFFYFFFSISISSSVQTIYLSILVNLTNVCLDVISRFRVPSKSHSESSSSSFFFCCECFWISTIFVYAALENAFLIISDCLTLNHIIIYIHQIDKPITILFRFSVLFSIYAVELNFPSILNSILHPLRTEVLWYLLRVESIYDSICCSIRRKYKLPDSQLLPLQVLTLFLVKKNYNFGLIAVTYSTQLATGMNIFQYFATVKNSLIYLFH